MEGEVRVTVIATGFDKAMGQAEGGSRTLPGVLPFPQRAPARPAAPLAQPTPVQRRPPTPPPVPEGGEVPEMEIPTFIRRQMD